MEKVEIIVEMDGYDPIHRTFSILKEDENPDAISIMDIEEAIHNQEFTDAWVNEHLEDTTLSTDVLKDAILKKIIVFTGEYGDQFTSIISNVMESGKFKLSDIEVFIKEDIFGDQTKNVKQIYTILKKAIEKKSIDLEGIKTLVVDNLLELDFVKDLVSNGWIQTTDLENLVKDGKFNGNALADMVTHGLLNVDFVQELGEKGYIDLKGFQDAISKIDFSTFDSITDPETIESIARGILPEKYKDWAVVAGDLVRQPDKAIYEAGEKALDLAGSEITAYIQGPGQETAKVLLDSIPGIGTFFKTTGLDNVVVGAVSTLAVEGINKLTGWIGKKLGFKAKKTPPPPTPVSFELTGAPKVVYSLNEDIPKDNIKAVVKMSDGTTKEVDYTELGIGDFDSSQYTEQVMENGILKDQHKEMSFSLKGSNLQIKFPYIVAQKFLNGVRLSPGSEHKTQYYVGEDFSKNGLKLTATFTDNTTMDVPEDSVVISGFNNGRLGSQSIKAWYGGEYYVDLSVSVVQIEPDSIEIVRLPDKMIFYVDEEFNADGLYVQGKFTINSEEKIIAIPSNLLTINRPTLNHVESGREILITYMGHSTSYTISVIDQSFDFVQVHTKPFKLKYRPGEKFSLNGMVIVGIKGDLTRVIIDPSDYTVTLEKRSMDIHTNQAVFQSSRYKHMKSISETHSRVYFKDPIQVDPENYYFSTEDVEGNSNYVVTITCPKNIFDENTNNETLSTSFELSLLPERTDFLRYEVTKLPNKVCYNRYESLDITGLEISALYGDIRNGKERILESIVINNESFSISPMKFDEKTEDGKDFKISFDAMKEREVLIVCEMIHSTNKDENVLKMVRELQLEPYIDPENKDKLNQASVCTFPVKIIDGTIEALKIMTLPKTTYQYGEEFDTNGLEVVGVYTNGYQWVIPNDQLEITGFNSLIPRHIKIQIAYDMIEYPTFRNLKSEAEPKTLYTNYTVEITKGMIESIAIRSLPSKTKYYPREKFDVRGLNVVALYNSGYVEKISLNDTRLKILGYYSLRVKKVVPITVDFHGFRAVFNVSIVQRNVHHISLEAPPNNVVYVAGQHTPANWLGMRVLAHNTNGGTTLLDINDVTIVGFDSDEPYGLIECSVDYEGYNNAYSTSLHLFILEGEVTKINMKSMPTKRVYGLYDEFDDTGLIVELECKNSVVPRTVPNDLLIIKGFNTQNATSDNEEDTDYFRTCTIMIGGVYTDPISFTYVVHDTNFKSLLLQKPVQTYLPEVYENKDEDGIISYPLDLLPYDTILVEQYETNTGTFEKKIYLHEILENTEEYTCSCLVLKDPKTNAKIGYRFQVTKNGIGTNESTMMFDFGVLENTIDGDPSSPSRTNYLIGDDLILDSTLSIKYIDSKHPTGNTINMTFDDTNSDEEKYYKHYGFSVIKPDMTYSGSKEVRIVSGMGHVWKVNINVVSPEDIPIGIELVSEPNKVDYNIGDEEIDLTGLIINQVYDDGTSIPLSIDGITVDSFDTSTIGTSTVVISYMDQIHTTFDIQVHAVPNNILVLQYPSRSVYYPNEEVDLTGLVMQAEYMDEYGHLYTETVPIEECEIHDFNTNPILLGHLFTNDVTNELQLLFNVQYRGCVVFIPYTLTIEDPSYVSAYPLKKEKDGSYSMVNGFYVLDQRQTKIHTNGTLHLEDITVEYIYPNGSVVKMDMNTAIKQISPNGRYINRKGVRSLYQTIQEENLSQKRGGEVNTIQLFDYEFTYEIERTDNGYHDFHFEGIFQADEDDKTTFILNPKNQVDVLYDLEFSIQKGTNEETYIYSKNPNYFENVPNLSEIGDHYITKDILFVKDGYVVELQDKT